MHIAFVTVLGWLVFAQVPNGWGLAGMAAIAAAAGVICLLLPLTAAAEALRFSQVDTSGDGRPGRDEMAAAFGLRAGYLFRRRDADMDGFISLAELQAFNAKAAARREAFAAPVSIEDGPDERATPRAVPVAVLPPVGTAPPAEEPGDVSGVVYEPPVPDLAPDDFIQMPEDIRNPWTNPDRPPIGGGDFGDLIADPWSGNGW